MGSEYSITYPRPGGKGIAHTSERLTLKAEPKKKISFSLSGIKQQWVLISSGLRSGPFWSCQVTQNLQGWSKTPQKPPGTFMCAVMWLLNIKRHLLRKVENSKRDRERDQVCHLRGTFWGRSGFQGQDAGSLNVFSASSLPRRGKIKVKCFETKCPLHTKRTCHAAAAGLEDLSL